MITLTQNSAGGYEVYRGPDYIGLVGKVGPKWVARSASGDDRGEHRTRQDAIKALTA